VSGSDETSSTEPDDTEDDVADPWLGRRDHWTDDDWQRWVDKTRFKRNVGPDFDEIVGQNVQRFRTAARMTQADLAAALSAEGDLFHQQTVQKIEKGLRPLKYGEAIRICNVLEVSPTQLADRGVRATSNANFREAIAALETIRAELESTAERLAPALVDVAFLIGGRNCGNPNEQPDEYLAEEAEGLVKTNWGKGFNQSIGEALRERLTLLIGVSELADAPTYVEILQNLIAEIQPITRESPEPPESWRDESDA
jgi:transcriptional regulator with XRE-family HTH domain